MAAMDFFFWVIKDDGMETAIPGATVTIKYEALVGTTTTRTFTTDANGKIRDQVALDFNPWKCYITVTKAGYKKAKVMQIAWYSNTSAKYMSNLSRVYLFE